MPAQVTVFGGTGFLGRRIVERLVTVEQPSVWLCGTPNAFTSERRMMDSHACSRSPPMSGTKGQ